MSPIKVLWAARFLAFRLLFGSFRGLGYIGKPVLILGARRIKVGGRFRLFPGARIEVFTSGQVDIGEDVGIGQNLHLTCGSRVVIGAGSRIAANVCITDTRHQFNVGRVCFAPDADTFYPTLIGKNCFIGYGAVLDYGTILGDGCVVGANSYLRGVYPAGCVIVGNPGRVVRRGREVY